MELTHRVISYYQYLANGKSKYYLHSPFLYDFKINILKERSNDTRYNTAEQIFGEYLDNDIHLHLKGSGSKNITKGRIKDIATNYSLNKKYGRMLLRMASYFNSKKIIELGTGLGISTAYLASSSPENEIVTFEAEKNLVELAKQSHLKHNCTNISYIAGNIDDTLPLFLSTYSLFDMAFIDANHTYNATINYFSQLLSHTHPRSIIVFDDIHWSKEMTRAWKEITSHPAVTLSIDLYRMGIVFLNPDLSKENYLLWF